jgi:phosphoribosylformimino-5-aminoimidazole carboxamide ribotide isomerase
MQVIPVIDLKAGAVVQARGGERSRYAPVRSRLCAGSEPLEVVTALLDVFRFTALYVADLDAIAGTGDHAATINAIEHAFPALDLWIDAGFRDARDCSPWWARSTATLVVGTETLRDANALRDLHDGADPRRWVLSLDHRGERPLGVPDVFECVTSWPVRVIVLTLDRVGTRAGPDLQLLDDVRTRAGSRQIYVGGGVRGGEDLAVLASRGLSGALVATALHERRLGRAEIAAVATGPARLRSEGS